MAGKSVVEEKSDDDEMFDLDDKSSISMAADTLFAVMEIAARKEDTDTLLNVTAAWLEINSRFSGDEGSSRGPIGFNAEQVNSAQAERVDEDDDESKSRLRVYKKYGKFRIVPRGHWRGR